MNTGSSTPSLVAENENRPSVIALGFVEFLRAEGAVISLSSALNYARALFAVGLSSRAHVYWAGRATLVFHPEDVERYDLVFARYWLGQIREVEPLLSDATPAPEWQQASPSTGESQPHDAPPTLHTRYASTEVLSHKDFASLSEEELADVHRLIEDLRVRAEKATNASLAKRDRASPRIDVRRSVRASVHTGGELIDRRFLERKREHPRIVVLCDVSGSMDRYAREFLHFMHIAVAGRSNVEAFALGTRLTRLTRALSSRDPLVAYSQASDAVLDWSGGTRLGEGLRAFNDGFGVRGVARGATVVILSDGLDRGDPALLSTELERLHHVARRVIWVNPLKGSAGYEPLARGMAAALVHVDSFVEGHSLAALEDLLGLIS